jgi:GAF domain-containing protein
VGHEPNLLAALIEFSDTLQADHDVGEFLQRLAERCVELIDTSEAGIMLADRDDTLRYIASSNDAVRLVELDQLRLDHGPSIDSHRTGVRVHCALATGAPDLWPGFAPQARAAGFASLSVFPMKCRDEVIGVLDLFSRSSDELGPGDVVAAQALADVATIGILQERALSSERAVTSQLENALASRVLIEQAKGVVAERYDLTMSEAFTLLRNYTRSHNRAMNETASDIISGRVTGDALSYRVGSPSPR